ncbi:MAG: hydantoinase/oxoprolinase [Candidatus Eremiobacteraeota bacterium]|nr:hydantoinase/oxoprolinase [Candidatus Eremiobacteraeota bacterium]
MTGSTLRVGIDVGGTFTDVVAIDARTRELVAVVKVPTTHAASEGVAAGIVGGLEALLASSRVEAAAIGFIAHSTTQATNALLEGDVANVAVVGLLDGAAWLSRRQMRFAPLRLESGDLFAPRFAFTSAGNDDAVRRAIDAVVGEGAEAVAASMSFGVDRPGRESFAVECARDRGVAATSGHDVSAAYGLRARTRTAALNAAILPKMLKTATMTARAVERAAIPAPLMVMRSDGGVMDVREIERRPILTLLSGPAAGIAGALLYERLSDGIFIEVGGTSSDCSAIRGGRPQMRAARIGGHRTMLRTLDVRTLGLGGGSLLRIADNRIVDVGPRSAHIAGCAYASFSPARALRGARLERGPHAIFTAPDGRRIAPTTTCAANLLGLVPEGAFAQADAAGARVAFELLAESLAPDGSQEKATPEALAATAIALATEKLRKTIEQLIAEYELDRDFVTLVGAGGGAGALVPALAAAINLPYRIARDAEAIAPIGVALALVRDVVERTIFAPSAEEIAALRREAADRVIAAGAAPEAVEVEVEIDTQGNRVIATASGATALKDSAVITVATDDERRAVAAESLRCARDAIESMELTAALYGYARRRQVSRAWRRSRDSLDLRVLDERGMIRLSVRDPIVVRTTVAALAQELGDAIEAATAFGDVGRALPAVYLLRGARLSAFEGLSSADQAIELTLEETAGCRGDETIAVLLVRRTA